MEAKIVKTLRLDLGDGKPPIYGEYLGRGKFAEAYRNGSDVYLLVNGCYMKEAIAKIRKKHVPQILPLGSVTSSAFGRETERQVYWMPFYEKLTAQASPEAWKQYKELARATDAARTAIFKQRGDKFRWYNNGLDIVYETIRLAHVSPSLKSALREIADAAANYGAGVCWEFSPRNLSLDKSGNLVLRDVLFDAGKMEEERAAAVRKHRGY